MNKELPAKGRVIFKHLHIFGFSAGYTDNICRLSLTRQGFHMKSKLHKSKAIIMAKLRQSPPHPWVFRSLSETSGFQWEHLIILALE